MKRCLLCRRLHDTRNPVALHLLPSGRTAELCAQCEGDHFRINAAERKLDGQPSQGD